LLCHIVIIIYFTILVGLTGSQILSNAFGFFAAGFETTSTTLSFCLHELALKKNIQDRVREEIKLTKIKYNGVINNEFLTDLIYLDMVIAGIYLIHF
jgi:cytochrome P450 family 6